MEILKRGAVKHPVQTTVTCPKCDTVFRCTPQKEGTMSPDPRDRGVWAVKCPLPECSHSVTVQL